MPQQQNHADTHHALHLNFTSKGKIVISLRVLETDVLEYLRNCSYWIFTQNIHSVNTEIAQRWANTAEGHDRVSLSSSTKQEFEATVCTGSPKLNKEQKKTS